MSHSPAPWEWERTADDGSTAHARLVARGANGRNVLIHHAGWQIEEGDLNLIEAGPALLKALRLALPYLRARADQGFPGAADDLAEAKAAVAQAEGETPR